MATEDLTSFPVDVYNPENTKAFNALLELSLPFSCSFVGLIQSHLMPKPKVWTTFNFSIYRVTPEVPEFFTVAVSTSI